MVKKKRSLVREILLWIFEIAIAVLLAFVLVYFFGRTRTNIGQSMEPTIQGGDTVLLDGLSYQLGGPRRNDIVAFRPSGSRGNASSVKRVLGLPGETIQIRDGMIYINGEVYLEKKDYPAMADAGLAETAVTLGAKEYFVLGDNRNNSEDSRYADVGIVSGAEIEGRVWLVLTPFEHFGFVK